MKIPIMKKKRKFKPLFIILHNLYYNFNFNAREKFDQKGKNCYRTGKMSPSSHLINTKCQDFTLHYKETSEDFYHHRKPLSFSSELFAD